MSREYLVPYTELLQVAFQVPRGTAQVLDQN